MITLLLLLFVGLTKVFAESLTFEEFKDGAAHRGIDWTGGKPVEEAFAILDVDGNGELDDEELQELHIEKMKRNKRKTAGALKRDGTDTKKTSPPDVTLE